MKKILVAILIGFSGCVMPAPQPQGEPEFDRTRCNRQAGYEQGFNDGRSGQDMNSRFAHHCRHDLREQTQSAYNDGYTKGRKQWDKGAIKRAPKQSPPLVSPPVGGINIQIGTRKEEARPNERAYFCEVRAFTKTFSAFGPTELEAKQVTQKKCQQRYHAMHCDEVKCQINR